MGVVAAEDAAVFAHVADVYFTLGYTPECVKTLTDALKMRPNNPLLLTTFAQILLEYVFPSSPGFSVCLALVRGAGGLTRGTFARVREGKVDEALKLGQAAIRASKDRPGGHIVVARAHLARKEYSCTIPVRRAVFCSWDALLDCPY